MIKKITWLLTFLLSFAVCQATFANDKCEKSNSSHSASCTCKHNAFFKKLDLTPDQLKQIKALSAEANVTREAQQKKLKALHEKIETMSSSTDSLDEAKLDMLLTQKKEIMMSLIKNKIKLRQEIYNLLNEKQKVQYDQMVRDQSKSTKN